MQGQQRPQEGMSQRTGVPWLLEEGEWSVFQKGCLSVEDWWSSDRYRKEARTAWFGEREKVKEVSICPGILTLGHV